MNIALDKSFDTKRACIPFKNMFQMLMNVRRIRPSVKAVNSVITRLDRTLAAVNKSLDF